jgi:putative sigma-54 modulation protein
MKVTVTARHADFTDGMKTYAYEKALRLNHYFDHLRKIEVILDVDGDRRYSAELIASAVRGHVLVCHAADQTAMAALDSVVDKMERQLTKFKEKLNDKHAKGNGKESRFNRRRPELVAGDNVGDLWW